ncbi:SCO family protein [Lentimicrobium sp.]|jgi:protein SCO1/2|uniref:SCO family protein n=1 Tax=Lentimicrobium sp. TaxID=2034841 RepID=UPI0025D1E3FE|nr:SCO family protein [Lentimicrobium sp.]MCO5256251.1 SCO family protein [Lentimicrobium sp.]MCO5262333.1 SCO family protein [Lentimicrobium sp.]HPF65354.1 SCO family protein [Lentimicrobium sp.]HPJ61180.1 SCO family protein [Lentimicrobium sp.]HPR25327.1 SCO family protein [Lentimicrobium sp.]
MKRFIPISLITFLIPLMMQGQTIKATQDIKSPELEIGIVEHLDEYIPDDLMLIDTTGQAVNLKQLIDKPTVLMWVYYRCPGICSPLMTSVAEVIGKTDLILGKDFQVITISFDAREGSDLAIRKRENYLNLIGKPVDESGWMFYTADSANIARGTEATGFRFKKAGNDFMHSAALIMISPDGKITRYLQGTYFLPFEFKMALIETSQGKSGPTIYKVLQFCYTYDPAGQQYVLNVTKVAGSLILIIALIVFLILVLKPRKKTTTN